MVPVESDSESDHSEVFEPGMPDDWEPPEWGRAEFAGEGAAAGAIVLHAMAGPDRVIHDAEVFCRDLQLDNHARQYMMSRSLE
eukprot:14039710-Alexandrium_andersonii.AAC.1